MPLLRECSCVTSRSDRLFAYLIYSDNEEALSSFSLCAYEAPPAHAVGVFARFGDSSSPVVGNNCRSATWEEAVGSVSLAARGDQAVVAEMLAEQCVAGCARAIFFPISVCFWQTGYVELVCRDVLCC